jgi:hypothetical protein
MTLAHGKAEHTEKSGTERQANPANTAAEGK